MTSFRHASVNLQGTDPIAQIIVTAKENAKRADIIGWQEAQNIAKEVLVPLGPGWSHSYCWEVPISWRNDVFKQVGDATKRLVHKGELGITPSRYIHTVVLEHQESGEQFAVVNTHVVHHIEENGLPMKYSGSPTKKGTEAYRFRDQHDRAKRHFAMLQVTFKSLTEQGLTFIWAGDLNVDYAKDSKRNAQKTQCDWFPYAMLHDHTTFLVPSSGTEGSRIIDWMGYHGTGVKPISVVTKLPKVNSDHSPVVVAYELVKVEPTSRGAAVDEALEILEAATPVRKVAKDAIAKAIAALEEIPPV